MFIYFYFSINCMVVKAERKRLLEFTEGLITNSGFTVLSRDYFYITIQGATSNIYVVLHSKQMTLNEFNTLNRKNLQKQIYTAHVFLKDDSLFHVRLGARGNLKGNDRSLKNYSKAEIDKMLHLRGLEKRTLDLQRSTSNLVYYQPRTERLEEALRGYNLSKVTLDYSHVDMDHRAYGFVENGASVDYKIADEVSHINGTERIKFGVLNRGNLQAIIRKKD